ncbi:MAG: transcriptional activator NhaR [Acidobacteria bacterium]|nr:MAG: transcriptional activator NhaR [Acidobacteriota bacterium]
MEWLNYHHLYYFWNVVKTGGVNQAASQLRVSPSAISAQLKELQANFGEALFVRNGRKLDLTEMGRTVFDYAEDIFTLGRELMDTVRNRPTGRPIRVDIGVADVLPKMIARWLIQPALQLNEPIRIVCREASSDDLIARLATLELDVVLSDSPADPNLKVRAYNHSLGDSTISFVGTEKLVMQLRGRFPECLHGAPILLPTDNTAIRRNLDYWFDSTGIVPNVIGEFEDHALLRAFGQHGTGLFPVPSVFENQLKKQDRLRRVGATSEVRTHFYAISSERKLKHPAVVAICESARRQLLDTQ